jgi:NitT/TauT family transport system permease protein
MLKSNIIKKAFSIIFALAVWQISAMIVGIDFLFPTPVAVVGRLFTIWREEGFLLAVTHSFLKISFGFFLALILGVLLAILAGRFSLVEELLWPFMLTIKSVPVASFIVLALMWLTSRQLSTFISFLMVLPVIYTNILGGIKNVDKGMDRMADIFRIPWNRRILYVWIPRIKPFLLSACTLALGLSWKAGIAAELIGVPSGSLGEMLYYSKIHFNTLDLFAWTLIIVFISVTFEKLVVAVLKLLFRRIEKI